jgi:V/A-type H+-transporting ATPase subunit I
MELLTHAFSTPKYSEIDPTVVLGVVFPLFFGFMIGDGGFGIALIVIGAFFMSWGKRFGMAEIGYAVLLAGIFSFIFGIFLFGDVFGIPFIVHPEVLSDGTIVEPERWASWSLILGMDIPLPSHIEKLGSAGVSELLVISLIAGFVHLFLGLVFGLINERHHPKHLRAKAGWLMLLNGFAMVIFFKARHTRPGSWMWNTFYAPFPQGVEIIGLGFPYLAFAFIFTGLALVMLAEGPIAILEVPTILVNIISYTRIAAIAVAKGAIAVAFNGLLLPYVFSGNTGLAIGVLIALAFIQFAMFGLGALSAGIQAIRLNYMEFFLKFFKGDGERYAPFGYRRRFSFAHEKTGAARPESGTVT